jgi:hypothetical protein
VLFLSDTDIIRLTAAGSTIFRLVFLVIPFTPKSHTQSTPTTIMMFRHVLLLLTVATHVTSAFVIVAAPPQQGTATARAAVIEPFMIDGAIALASAAAGAASQFPRIQQLERELDSARSALTQVRCFSCSTSVLAHE